MMKGSNGQMPYFGQGIVDIPILLSVSQAARCRLRLWITRPPMGRFSKGSCPVSRSVPSTRRRSPRPLALRHADFAAAARACVESLEDRRMFAVFSGIDNGELVVNSGNGDTVTVDHAGTKTLVNGVGYEDADISDGIRLHVGSFFGPGHNTVNVRATIKPIFMDSPGGRIDHLTIGGKAGVGAQGVQALVDVTGMNFGIDEGDITIDDSQNAAPRTVRMQNVDGQHVLIDGLAGARIRLEDDAFRSLDLKGGSGGNTFNVDGTPEWNGLFDLRNVDTTIYSGTGNDVVNVRRAQSFMVSVQGQQGHDTVNVGNNGSLQGIVGQVRVHNTGNLTTLTVDGSADTTARQVKIGHFDSYGDPDQFFMSVHGLAPAPILYTPADVDTFTVKAGSGGNTITVHDAATAIFGKTVLNSGAGKDRVFVRHTSTALDVHGQNGADVVDVGNGNNAQGIVGALRVDNAASKSVLNVHNSADNNGRTATLDTDSLTFTGSITGLTPGRITYKVTDVSNLGISTGGQADTFVVRGVLGAATSLYAGGGLDVFDVGSSFNSLSTIRAPLTVDGQGGTDFLFVRDQGANQPHTYTTTTDAVLRSSANDGTVTVGYAGLEALSVSKGPVINPHPPLAKQLALPKTATVGQHATLTGVLEDKDAKDSIKLSIDWGDGSKPQTSKPDRKPFAVKHKFTKAGTYTVRVIWTDSTGESNFRELKITVKAAPPFCTHAIK
jgi:hypothetical protein